MYRSQNPVTIVDQMVRRRAAYRKPFHRVQHVPTEGVCGYCVTDDTPDSDVCKSRWEGFCCTRYLDHGGNHVACGLTHEARQWARAYKRGEYVP